MERSEELAREWLEKVSERLPEEPHRLFPTRSLLNQMPQLLRRIAAAIAEDRTDVSEPLIERETLELVELRRAQGYELPELTAEFELLGEIFFGAIAEELAAYAERPPPLELLRLAQGVHQRFAELSRMASSCFRSLRAEDRRQRAELLHRYARSLEHELRNWANNASLQIQLAREAIHAADLSEAVATLDAAAEALRKLTARGVDSVAAATIQRIETFQSARVGLDVCLHEVVADLRPFLEDHGIEIHLASSLPEIQLDAGRIHLALSLLIGAAVDPLSSARETQPLRVGASRQRGQVRIEIEYTGAAYESLRAALSSGTTSRASSEDSTSWTLPDVVVGLARSAIEPLHGRVTHEQDARGSRLVICMHEPPAELPAFRSRADRRRD